MALENMRDAVQAIGRRTGITDLTPNADGVFELVIGGFLPVFFQDVGETELEVQIRVPGLENTLNNDMMSALLRANLDTQHGRFGLEPGTNKVVFGGRINVTSHNEDSLMRTIDAIIKEGASWNGNGLEALKQDARAGSGSENVMSETLMRV